MSMAGKWEKRTGSSLWGSSILFFEDGKFNMTLDGNSIEGRYMLIGGKLEMSAPGTRWNFDNFTFKIEYDKYLRIDIGTAGGADYQKVN